MKHLFVLFLICFVSIANARDFREIEQIESRVVSNYLTINVEMNQEKKHLRKVMRSLFNIYPLFSSQQTYEDTFKSLRFIAPELDEKSSFEEIYEAYVEYIAKSYDRIKKKRNQLKISNNQDLALAVFVKYTYGNTRKFFEIKNKLESGRISQCDSRCADAVKFLALMQQP